MELEWDKIVTSSIITNWIKKIVQMFYFNRELKHKIQSNKNLPFFHISVALIQAVR